MESIPQATHRPNGRGGMAPAGERIMKMAKNRIKLNICGCECALCSDDSENYIRSIGDEVQKAIDDLMAKNERISVTLAAVITALSYCDESHKAASTAENLRSQIKNYLEDSSHARMDAEESRRELERMKKENQTLRARLSAAGKLPEGETEEPVAPAVPGTPAPQQTGDFSRVKPEAKADQESFMSFFEKNSNEP
jgi:cell division protein ZapA (FtsZ GTPase activity inhibitor)